MVGRKASAEQKSETASETISQFVVVCGIRLEITRKITRPFPVSAKAVKNQPKYQNHVMLDMMRSRSRVCDVTSGAVLDQCAVLWVSSVRDYNETLIVYSKKWKNADNAISRVLDIGGGTANAVSKYAENSRYCLNLISPFSHNILALVSCSAAEAKHSHTKFAVSWYRFVWVQQWSTRENVKR